MRNQTIFLLFSILSIALVKASVPADKIATSENYSLLTYLPSFITGASTDIQPQPSSVIVHKQKVLQQPHEHDHHHHPHHPPHHHHEHDHHHHHQPHHHHHHSWNTAWNKIHFNMDFNCLGPMMTMKEEIWSLPLYIQEIMKNHSVDHSKKFWDLVNNTRQISEKCFNFQVPELSPRCLPELKKVSKSFINSYEHYMRMNSINHLHKSGNTAERILRFIQVVATNLLEFNEAWTLCYSEPFDHHHHGHHLGPHHHHGDDKSKHYHHTGEPHTEHNNNECKGPHCHNHK